MSTYNQKQKRTLFIFIAIFILLVMGIAAGGTMYTHHGHKLPLFPLREVQFVTEGIIYNACGYNNMMTGVLRYS